MAVIGNLGTASSIRVSTDLGPEKPVPRPMRQAEVSDIKIPAQTQVARSTEKGDGKQTRDSSDVRGQAIETKIEQPQRRTLEEFAEMLRTVNLTFDLFEIQAKYIITDGDISVQIINQRTGEVIRKIPPYEVPKIIEALKNGDPMFTDSMA